MVWVTGNGLEKACVSRPGRLLHCIDATGELPPMCFAEQTIYTTNVLSVLPTLTTSASQSPAFLVGQMFVWQNAATCLSLQQEHSSANKISMLQPQLCGTCFPHSTAHHPLVVDSLELG